MRKLFTALAAVLFFSAAHAQIFCACKISSSGSYTGEVATRAWVMDSQSSTNRQVMSRTTHYMRASVTTMQVVMPNYEYNGSDVCADGTAASVNGTCPSATIDLSLEYPAGTCTRITFSTASSATTTGALFPISDAITAPPVGAEFWIRSYYVGTAGVIGETQDSATFDEANVGVSGVADQTLTCDAITNNGNHIHPAAIVGSITQPSICLLGDSIMIGSSTAANSVGDNGIVAPITGPLWGYIQMATGASVAYNWQNSKVSQYVANLYCSHEIGNFGIVDFVNGQSVAQLEASLTNIYSAFKGPSFQTTLTPYTATTDLCATTINQTPEAWETNRSTFNSALRGATFIPNGGIFDVDSVLGTGTNFDLWTPSLVVSANPCVHPNTAGYTALQNAGIIDTGRIAR